MKTSKQQVLEVLGLNRGAGLGLVLREAQKYFNEQFSAAADPTRIELHSTEDGQGWTCMVVWLHHDGDIVEAYATAGTPWHATYNCLAAYLRTMNSRATMPAVERKHQSQVEY